MLFALSRFSISCSKLSKAVSLSARAMVGDWMAAMDSFIRSASEGPPRRAERAAALRGRAGLGEVVLVVVVDGSVGGVSEFSMLHFRSWFMPGSMVGLWRRMFDERSYGLLFFSALNRVVVWLLIMI